MKNNIEALYIHIPFCHQLCHYCDFAKLYANADLVKKYVQAIEIELKLKLSESNNQLKSVYFGGGTPSILTKEQLEPLFQALRSFIGDNTEITFEMNPEDVTKEYLTMLATFGVNRVSLGVQTFNDILLDKIGRNHTSKESERAINLLKKSPIKNVTIDLMFALPGQTMQQLERDIEIIKQYDLPHISIYSLILEERTKLYIQRKQYDLLDDEIEAQMYEYVISELQKSGYNQYEISNFSKTPQHMSQHNLAYWHQKQYYGVGLGAHQFIASERTANTKSITKYNQMLLEKQEIPQVMCENLTQRQLFEEFCFLAFRDRQKGLVLFELQQKYTREYEKVSQSMLRILTGLVEEKLIEEYAEASFRLTRRGLMFANDVFSAFVQIEET